MKPTIIGIAGGTASGKTTIAKKIYEQTKSYGTITLIRMDDYYKTFPNIPVDERGNKNFDHPDSYDTPLLVSDLKKLQQGLPIEKPIYDFVVSNRSNKTETICIIGAILKIPEVVLLITKSFFISFIKYFSNNQCRADWTN